MIYTLIGGLEHPFLSVSDEESATSCLEYMQDFFGFPTEILGSIDLEDKDIELFEEILDLNYGMTESAYRVINHGSTRDLFKIPVTKMQRAYLHSRLTRYGLACREDISPYDHQGFPNIEIPYWVDGVLLPIFFAKQLPEKDEISLSETNILEN